MARYTPAERRAAIDAALRKMAELRETLELLNERLGPDGVEISEQPDGR